MGALSPQTQHIGSLGTHPVLTTSHGWAMSLLGWVQTQQVLTERSGTGQRGDAGCKGKLYLGPTAGKHKGVPGPMLSSAKTELFLLRHRRRRRLRRIRMWKTQESHPAVCETSSPNLQKQVR